MMLRVLSIFISFSSIARKFLVEKGTKLKYYRTKKSKKTKQRLLKRFQINQHCCKIRNIYYHKIKIREIYSAYAFVCINAFRKVSHTASLPSFSTDDVRMI